jgi:ATP adenylyltransferase
MLGVVADEDCLICQKHRGWGPLVGPLVHQDALLFVTHRGVGSLGYVFVETQRHVSALDELTDPEAEALGRVTAQLARGLRAELEVEHVHSMVAGLGVAHFHQHVFVRHAGTPDSYGWCESWPDAPRGNTRDFADRLSAYIG